MNIRKNKGITLISLVVTIIILLIISGITITGTIVGVKETEENAQISELKIIQHAIFERYTKSQLTKEELPGTIIEKAEVQIIIDEINLISGNNVELKGNEYRKLNGNDLKNLGISESKDTYIVNYSTGEVINETIKVTKSKKALYVYSKAKY